MLRRLLIAGLLAVMQAAVFAHHSTALYDMTTAVTVEGRLADVRWSHPHPTANISSNDKTWRVTFPPIGVLAARGLTQEALASAQAVTIVGNPRKDGTAELRVERLTVDGKRIL